MRWKRLSLGHAAFRRQRRFFERRFRAPIDERVGRTGLAMIRPGTPARAVIAKAAIVTSVTIPVMKHARRPKHAGMPVMQLTTGKAARSRDGHGDQSQPHAKTEFHVPTP